MQRFFLQVEVTVNTLESTSERDIQESIQGLLDEFASGTATIIKHSVKEHIEVSELERVFGHFHQYHDRIFYDRKEGKYYDQSTDLYLTEDDVRSFGIP